jgi:hypothetical protein
MDEEEIMSGKAYIQRQIVVIHRYARLLGVEPETAAQRWVSSGLALRFWEKHHTF